MLPNLLDSLMGRTLLVGNSRSSWREWLKANRDGRDLLCLDPADPQQGIPGRLALFRGEHPVFTRFYGSLDPQRSPHVILSCLAAALPTLSPDALVQLFPYRPTPVLRQTAMIVAELLRPAHILVGQETRFSTQGLPGVHDAAEIEDAVSVAVQHAQRKAQWLRLLEECEDHEVDMRTVAIEGARLGAGEALTLEERDHAGLGEAVHAERCGNALLIVSPVEMEENEVSRALDVSGCTRATMVEPDAYDNLSCAFARVGGEEIGTGFIQRIDWADHRMYIKNSAIAPASPALIRLGSLRVDLDGRELPELRPWQA